MTIRINKYLSMCGLSPRRKVVRLIKAEEILINGKPAEIGQLIDQDNDTVTYKNDVLKLNRKFTYLAFHKPVGVLSSVSDDRGRKTVLDYVDIKGIYPIGRLDYLSSGLIILTNDGDFALKLAHPRYRVSKTYKVVVDKNINNSLKNGFLSGINIEGKQTQPANIKYINYNEFEVVLYEGLKRQIREICKKHGFKVISLKRTKIGSLSIGDPKEGEYRKLTRNEIDSV